VGKRAVAALEARGHGVVPFDIRDASSGHLNDICNPDVLAAALTGADGVIHLAAISRVAWGEQRPDLCQRVNVGGTATLLASIHALDPVPWLVFVSSREIYGDAAVLPVDEDAPVRPVNVYGRSKAAGELMVAQARANGGVRSAIVRLSSIYGATNDHHDRVIPALLWHALAGEELTITGAANRFDFVHVDDSVAGLLRAADLLMDGAPAVPTVHLTTGVGTSLSALAERAIAIAGSTAKIRAVPARPFDVGGFIGDPTRAHHVLNWNAAINLEQGISALYEAMRSRGSPLAIATIPDPEMLARRRKDRFRGPAPRVSIVVPCYNSAWSIERTLTSILAQRFTDFELIIVNDGSTDNLHERIAGFLADPRLRVIDQENRGLAGARNRGIAEARADLVAPIDADDLWHPDFLAATVAALDGDPAATFAYTYSFRIDEQDHLLPILRFRHPPRHDFLGLLSLNSVSNGSAAIFRRALLQKVGGYDETMRHRAASGAEDWKLVLQLATIGSPALVERHLVGYRLVHRSMSQTDPRRQLQAILTVIADLRSEFPDVPPRWFADGRTMMIAWLLPAFLRRGMLGEAVRQGVRAYLCNPLWFRNPAVRKTHLFRLRLMARYLFDTIRGRSNTYPALHSAEMEGERPFAYMEPRRT
jgi:nucleoside-diphosphate-sugar epimerase/glycosyltransferase involved in cell wall biosynthesis